MPSTKPPFDPTAYALKRKEQIEKAKELRSARSMVLSNSPPRDPSGVYAGWAEALRRSSYPSDGAAGFPRRSRSRGASPPRRFGPNDPLSGNTRRARSRGASPPRRMGSLLETVDPPQRRGRGIRKNSLPEDGPAMAFDERESSWLVGSNGKANQDDLSSFLDLPESVSSEPASRTRRAVSGPVMPPNAKTELPNSAVHERRTSLGNIVVSTTPRSTKKTKENSEGSVTEPTTPGSKDGTGGEGASTDSDTTNPSTEGKGKGIFSRFRSSTMKLFRKGMGGGSATTDVEHKVPASPSTPPHSSTSPRPAPGGSRGKAVPSDLTGTTLSALRRVPLNAERSHGFESPSKRGPNKLPSSSPGGTLLQNSSESTGDGNHSKTTPKSLESGNRKKSGMASDPSTGKEITGSNPTATPIALQSKTVRNGEGISGRGGAGKGTETKGLTTGGTATPVVSKGPVGRGTTGGTGVSPGSVGKEGRPIKAVPSTPSDRMRASADSSASESHGESETTKLGRQSDNSIESVANGEAKEKTSWFTRSKNEGKVSKQSEGLSRSASAGLPPEHVDKDPQLQKCPDCGRKFFSEALQKHSRVCRKVFLTKRKAFNSTVKRLAGTEAAQYLKPAKKGSTKSVKEDLKKIEARKTVVTEGKKPKWRAQSEELQAAIRAARQEKGRLAKPQHGLSST